ncbi:MAG: M56 family metallopeptidase [Planctomycetota bacterium]
MTLWEAALSNAIWALIPAGLAIIASRGGKRPALVRVLWLLVFIKLITPPVFRVPCGWPASEVTRPIVQAVVEPTARLPVPAIDQHPLIDLESSETPTKVPMAVIPATLPEIPSSWWSSLGQAWRPWLGWQSLLALWGLGIGISVVQAITRLWRFHRVFQLSSQGSEALQQRVQLLATRMRLKRVPTVRLLDGAPTPMLWVPWQAYLIIPTAQAEQLEPSQLDALIAHELAHLRSGGHWVRWLELSVGALYWWHPVVWLARRGIQEAEEQICDAWVIQVLPQMRKTYAQTLIDLVSQFSGKRLCLPPGASGLSQFQLVKRRISMILHGKTAVRLTLSGWIAVSLVAGCLLPITPIWGRPQAAERPMTVEVPGPERIGATVTVELPEESPQHRLAQVEAALADKLEVLEVRVAPLHRDDDRDTVDADDLAAQEVVATVIVEMQEAIADMDQEVREAIDEAQTELKEMVREAPEAVQREMLDIDVRAILKEAVREAPHPVKLFVKAVDPVEVVEAQLAEVEFEVLALESDEALRDRVQARFERELRQHIDQLSSNMQREISDIQQEIARETHRSPASIQRVLLEVDFDQALSDVLAQSSPIVQQLVKDVHVEEVVKGALAKTKSARETAKRKRERASRASGDHEHDRIAHLERRLERLLQEADDIVDQLEQMRDR